MRNNIVGSRRVKNGVDGVIYNFNGRIYILIPVGIRKRKRAGATHIKAALLLLCLLPLVLTIILSYWFNFMGLLSWSIGFYIIDFSCIFH